LHGGQRFVRANRSIEGQFAKPGILPWFAHKWPRRSRVTFIAAHACAGAVLQTAMNLLD
jgi:hypothetical protein